MAFVGVIPANSFGVICAPLEFLEEDAIDLIFGVGNVRDEMPFFIVHLIDIVQCVDFFMLGIQLFDGVWRG